MKKTQYCYKCGAEIDQADKFCIRCGVKLYRLDKKQICRVNNQSEKRNNLTHKTKFWPLILLIVLFFVLFTVCVFLFIIHKDTEEDRVEKQITQQLSNPGLDQARDEDIPIAERIYRDMTYEILSVHDSYCEISVTAPDIASIFSALVVRDVGDNSSDPDRYQNTINDLLDQLEMALTSKSYDTITTIVEVPIDSSGEIEITSELIDAFYGGLLTLQEQVLNEYIQFGESE